MWRRWDTPQNFFLAFIDELENQIIIKKLLKWANIKQIILIFTMLHLLKKKKERKTPVDIIIKISNSILCSSWDKEQNKRKLVILGLFIFCPLSPWKTQKSKFWKMKKFAGDINILHMCIKNHNHMTYSSWDTEWDKQNILSFWAIFFPFNHPPSP